MFTTVGKEGIKSGKIVHVYGLTHSGKSYLVDKRTEAPKRRAIIDFEKGMEYLVREGDLYYVPPSSEKCFEAMHLAAKNQNVDCLIIDGCSTLWSLLQFGSARANNKGVVTVDMGSWGVIKARLESELVSFIATGKDLWLIQRAENEKDSNGKLTGAIEPQGSDIFKYLASVSVLCQNNGGKFSATVVKERKKVNP